MTSMYEQFMDLKRHAAEMVQAPTRWVVGAGVVEAVQKYMGFPGAIRDTDVLEYLRVPMERSADLSYGRVTLECDQWSAGAFTINPILKEGE